MGVSGGVQPGKADCHGDEHLDPANGLPCGVRREEAGLSLISVQSTISCAPCYVVYNTILRVQCYAMYNTAA